MNESEKPVWLCFGECLWDCLPEGLFAGGAPMNVAIHLSGFGERVAMVSAVGRDFLGDELIRRMQERGVDTHYVRRVDLETGRVVAKLSQAGDATYSILAPVAWDRIADGPIEPPRRCAGIVFGSLALRSAANEAALVKLINRLPDSAWRVFDVNLRAPHFIRDAVLLRARDVDLLKVNDEEAAFLTRGSGARPEASPEADARRLASATGAKRVCVTAGGAGAGLLIHDTWFWEPSRPVQVADTVGAGDAFLAALLSKLSAGANPSAALAGACRVGEFVASKRGATPIVKLT